MSGAATKIVAHIAHCQNLEEDGYKPTVFAGVSSGILATIAWAFNKLPQAENLAKNLEYKHIFGKVPVNKNGKISVRGYARGLFTGYFGDSEGLFKTLKSFINEQEWNDFVKKEDKDLYCGVYNITLRHYELIYLNICDYETFLKYTVASCTIPMYCKPIKIGNYLYWDGGVQEHNPSGQILNIYKGQVKNLVSIYSRPKDKFQTADWGYSGKSIGRSLSVLTDAMQDAISYSNQEEEVIMCELNKINLIQLFAPRIMKGIYDIDKTRLNELYEAVKN
jgi:hypothetical protein